MEELYSVGIDIGTSTTQLVISKLTLENRGNAFSVPQIAIAARTVIYRSGIHFTPLLSATVIDMPAVREIVAEEYRKSGFAPADVDTGAVIITGETARKENARAVADALADFAGDFVVATAGPDLESILAARGAGADVYAREHHTDVLHFDIGGGTANLAYYAQGALQSTGCLDIGGRLMKLDADGTITYLSRKMERLIARLALPLAVGVRATPSDLAPVIDAMVEGLAQAAGLCPKTDLLELLTTHRTVTLPGVPACISFSGGVADCIDHPPDDWRAYGDLGVLLGRGIRDAPAFQAVHRIQSAETIRATVVGAGSHATALSGSTIFYRDVDFPLKNLPILKLTAAEEQGDADTLSRAIAEKLHWFADERGLTQTALCLRGVQNPGYARITVLADGVRQGLAPLLEAGYFPVLVVEADLAQVLGQALAARIPGPLLCLDGVAAENGDYIDVGTPVAAGAVLPIIIKTLVFHDNA